jgi:hypothetical protein
MERMKAGAARTAPDAGEVEGMDPRDRAEAALARARARGAHVVTPDDAVSPMDAANTLQIPRIVVDALDSGSPDTTMVLPTTGAEGQTQPLRAPAQHSVAPPNATAQQHPQHPQQPAQAKPMTQYIQAPGARPQPAAARPPEEDTQPRDLGGLVPTVQQPGAQRSMLSRRLDGQ